VENTPTIILNGHLDTVGTGEMAEPFAGRIEGERLLGRGAADMKGGVAAIVVAAERLVSSRAAVRPVLALVADEEDASVGSEAVIEALPSLGVRPDACLITEPTDLAVARSLRGFALVQVSFTGRAAHSSQPQLGVNAVSRLGSLVSAVDAQAPAIRAKGGDFMVTMASGGDSPFVIPDRAECLVERRTVPGESGTDALAEVQALLPPSWEATAELVAERPPWQLDDAGPAAELAARLASELGTTVTFDAPYWMEAPLWQQLCPTLICGPSGGGLHADDEWLDLGQLRAFTAGLVTALSGGPFG
jgi:acetylornithine deacetylase